MQKVESLLEFFRAQTGQISLLSFSIHLLLAGLTSFALGRFYSRFGQTLSNRDAFGRNFMLITMTTMMIITIVKSSLALSLGLVGALSIIRFRAAIKEPEELSYLFLAISLGLGFGAEQTAVTLLAFAIILAILSVRFFVRNREDSPTLYLTITSTGGSKLKLNQIMDLFSTAAIPIQLKRLDETDQLIEASFRVQFQDVAGLESVNRKLREASPDIRLSYLDERGIGL